jgi:predicted transcriptional regulator
VLKIVASGADTVKEIHKEYVKEYEKVSRRFIIKELNRLIKAGLIERSGAVNNFKYSLTSLGKLIVG